MKDRRALTPRQEALTERALYNALLTLRSVDECRAFLRDLCTPAELQALAGLIIGLLARDLFTHQLIDRGPQADIGDEGRIVAICAECSRFHSLKPGIRSVKRVVADIVLATVCARDGELSAP